MNNFISQDRLYVAKQLNGPVVSGIINAVYSFFHKDIDEHAAYFRKLSIDTADTSHLLFIGKLMGVQLFNLLSDAGGNKYLTFQEGNYDIAEFTYDNGWAEDYLEGSDDITGVFGTGAEQGYPIALSNAQYARILSAISAIPSASINSIFAIDTITSVVANSTEYTISYNTLYPDTIDIVLSGSVPANTTSVLQGIFDRLLKGGATVLVTRS